MYAILVKTNLAQQLLTAIQTTIEFSTIANIVATYYLLPTTYYLLPTIKTWQSGCR